MSLQADYEQREGELRTDYLYVSVGVDVALSSEPREENDTVRDVTSTWREQYRNE